MTQMNLLTKQKETHRLQKETHGCCGVRNSEGIWEGHVYTAIFKMDNQQKPIVQHMELCFMCQLGWEGTLGENNKCICMAESLHCIPEIISTWLIGCTPIQNVFGVKKKSIKIKLEKEKKKEI